MVEIPALDISSSDIRIRLRDGESVRYLLPPDVEEAIEKNGTYRGVERERCG
jgi:nicotinate-nucleotide adenylyltransferase